jgi:hypothetical protein
LSFVQGSQHFRYSPLDRLINQPLEIRWPNQDRASLDRTRNDPVGATRRDHHRVDLRPLVARQL